MICFFVITPDTRIQKINRAVVNLLGYSAEELLGQPLQNFLAPDDRLIWQESTALNATKLAMRNEELRFVTKDGQGGFYTAVFHLHFCKKKTPNDLGLFCVCQ